MDSFNTNSPSPIPFNKKMDQHKANVINRISSTPVTKPPRESLCWIKKNTVSGLVNRFTQKAECANNVADRMPANGPIARQVSFFADFSTVNEGTRDIVESKLDSVDSGNDLFRRRSRSVNISSVNNTSKTLLAEYEKFPNFKFSYLKYFGVEPTEYLSKFGIDYDPVSDSIRKDSPDGEDIGCEDSVVIANNIMRKRSQTVSSTAVNINKSKYFAAESRKEGNAKKNRLMKVATATDRSNYEDVFVTKVAAIRDAKNSLRSVGTQTCPEQKFQYVDSDVVALCDKAPPKRPSKRDVDRNLISRVQQSIKSYNSVLKSLRKNDISEKKRAGFDE